MNSSEARKTNNTLAKYTLVYLGHLHKLYCIRGLHNLDNMTALLVLYMDHMTHGLANVQKGLLITVFGHTDADQHGCQDLTEGSSERKVH